MRGLPIQPGTKDDLLIFEMLLIFAEMSLIFVFVPTVAGCRLSAWCLCLAATCDLIPHASLPAIVSLRRDAHLSRRRTLS